MIAAFLILIGCEYRIQDAPFDDITAHIYGLQVLMRSLSPQKSQFVNQMQRTLFWQDLICSLVTGAPRVLHLET